MMAMFVYFGKIKKNWSLKPRAMRPIEGCNTQLYQWSQEKTTTPAGFYILARGRSPVIKGKDSEDGPIRFVRKIDQNLWSLDFITCCL